jgi:glycosyltransferase involved in cell wall biosynthesis
VRALIRELTELNWENQVAAPASSQKVENVDEVTVHSIRTPHALPQTVLYGDGEPSSAVAFAGVLDQVKPDVLHFHAYSPAVSVLWLAAAHARGIPCVYTYHTPTLACGRGTLMRWGVVPCDGKMTPLRCAACTLHGLGVSKPMSWVLAVASPLTQGLGARVPFRIRPLIQRRTSAVHQWLGGMSRVVALCQWAREVMLRNGVPAERLRVVRHALAGGENERRRDTETGRRRDGETLKVAFFGRLDQTKGLQVLVEALRLMPGLKMELHCHLISAESANTAMKPLLNLMKEDARVQMHPAVASDEVVRTMASYDAVAVPSIWLETGPLVVLEAFEAGVPVLGSRLGGIAEWVTDERDGLLIEPGNAAAWAHELKRLVGDPELCGRLRRGVTPPPRMNVVAQQMDRIYREALDLKHGRNE